MGIAGEVRTSSGQTHIKSKNSRADALAKLATASQEDLNKLTPIEHLSEPSVDLNSGEVSHVMSEPSWMDPIWGYLIEGLLPNDPKEASKLRSKSARFTIHRGALYKRGFFTPILKCIAGGDADYVLREVHEGVCGNHIEARVLIRLGQEGVRNQQNLYPRIPTTDVAKLLQYSGSRVEHGDGFSL